jgi:hypothetical protein
MFPENAPRPIPTTSRTAPRRLELELSTQSGTKGEYRCPACGELLEKFNGNALVAYRLTRLIRQRAPERLTSVV